MTNEKTKNKQSRKPKYYLYTVKVCEELDASDVKQWEIAAKLGIDKNAVSHINIMLQGARNYLKTGDISEFKTRFWAPGKTGVLTSHGWYGMKVVRDYLKLDWDEFYQKLRDYPKEQAKEANEEPKAECYDKLPLALPEPKQEPKHTKLAQAFRLIAEWLEETDG